MTPVRAYPLVGSLADRPAAPTDKDEVYFAVDGNKVTIYICSDDFQWIEAGGGKDKLYLHQNYYKGG